MVHKVYVITSGSGNERFNITNFMLTKAKAKMTLEKIKKEQKSKRVLSLVRNPRILTVSFKQNLSKKDALMQ
jgi:hypothetical protein